MDGHKTTITDEPIQRHRNKINPVPISSKATKQ